MWRTRVGWAVGARAAILGRMFDAALDVTLGLAVVGALFAGVVKGATAGGFPLIATPILAMILGPRPAVIAVSLPTLLLNTVQALGAKGHRGELRRIIPLLVAEVLAIPVGVWLLVRLDPRVLSVVIGLFVLFFVLLAVRFPFITLRPGPADTSAGIVAGFVGGLMGGTTGFFGPPLTVYFFALRVDKELYVFLLSITYEVITLAQVGTYLIGGLYTDGTLLVGLLLCPPALLGFALGVRLRSRIDQRAFNRLVLLVLVVSGLNLLVRPLLTWHS